MRFRFFSILCILALVSMTACSGSKKKFAFSGSESADQAFAKCLQLLSKKSYQEAVECFEILKSHFPKSAEAQEAELKIGDAHWRRKEYKLAASAYEVFITKHPESPKLDYAYYQLGLSYLKQSPKAYDRDQSYLKQVLDYFQTVVRRFPSSTYAIDAQVQQDQVRKKMGMRELYIGRFYCRTGQYKAAVPRLEKVLSQYSGLGLEEKASKYLEKSYRKLGQVEEADKLAAVLKEQK